MLCTWLNLIFEIYWFPTKGKMKTKEVSIGKSLCSLKLLARSQNVGLQSALKGLLKWTMYKANKIYGFCSFLQPYCIFCISQCNVNCICKRSVLNTIIDIHLWHWYTYTYEWAWIDSSFQPSEPKIKSSRMLLLELTDGTQTVFGMEYHLIPFLKVTTPPGTKVTVCEFLVIQKFRVSCSKISRRIKLMIVTTVLSFVDSSDWPNNLQTWSLATDTQ